MTGERAAYLAEVAAVLWPPPATVSIGAGRARLGPRRHRELPGAAPGRRPAAGAAGRPGAGRGRGPALRGQPVVAGGGPVPAARRGAAGRRRAAAAARPGGGHRPGRLADGRAAPRRSAPTCRSASTSDPRGPTASRCCSCSTPTGGTIGFAKFGVDRAHPAAGRAPRPPRCRRWPAPRCPTVEVPRVLHHAAVAGTWQVLVQSALPVWEPRPHARPGGPRRGDAMAEVAGPPACAPRAGWPPARTGGPARAAPPGWHRGRRAPPRRGSCWPRDAGRRARGRRPCRYGAWHGDWAPWNMADRGRTRCWSGTGSGSPPACRSASTRALRAAGGAPAARGRPAGRVDPDGAGRAAGAARPVRAGTRPRRGRWRLLYLVDLAARYLTTGQAEAGARLGVLGTWLLPVLIRRSGDEREPDRTDGCPAPRMRPDLGSRRYGPGSRPAPG